MTRNTVAVVSAVLFVVLAALLAVLPVPYVTVGPGESYNMLGSVKGQPAIRVDGVATYPTSGRILLPTVSQSRADAHTSLPEALLSFWSSQSEVLPRDWVYQSGKSNEQLYLESSRQINLAQHYAAVAAMREAGIPVQELPMVATVNVAGPAYEHLRVGDFITKVDDVSVSTEANVRELIARQPVGKTVLLEVLRGNQVIDIAITTSSSNDNKSDSTIGVGYATGYRYGPTITFGSELNDVGGSAGLAYALSIYDMLTSDELLGTRSIGVAGTIDPHGKIGKATNIRQRVFAAKRAEATAFLVPAESCADVTDLQSDLTLVKVTTLNDAISALKALARDGDKAEVARC